LLHGRYVCVARVPACPKCIIADLCEYPDKTKPKELPASEAPVAREKPKRPDKLKKTAAPVARANATRKPKPGTLVARAAGKSGAARPSAKSAASKGAPSRVRAGRPARKT